MAKPHDRLAPSARPQLAGVPQGKYTNRFQTRQLAVCIVASCIVNAIAQTVPPPASSAEQEQRRAQERERSQREQLERAPDVRLGASASSAARLPQEANCFVINQLSLKTIEGEQPQVAARFGWVIDSLAGPEQNDSPLRRCIGSAGVSLLLKRVLLPASHRRRHNHRPRRHLQQHHNLVSTTFLKSKLERP